MKSSKKASVLKLKCPLKAHASQLLIHSGFMTKILLINIALDWSEKRMEQKKIDDHSKIMKISCAEKYKAD